MQPPFDRVRFVLVQPTLAANVGAAARAIKTMGFGRLVVVDPRDAGYRSDADAIALATGAADVLGASVCATDLASALAGVDLAIAMTGYDREFGPPLLDLRQVAGQAAQRLAAAERGDVAFVFGTERSGLANADVLMCQIACAIPANPQFASLNLAQSVQVAAYECQLALRATAAIQPGQLRFGPEDAPAGVAALEKLYRHFEEAATAVGFHDPAEPKTLMVRVRRLFNRARPTQTEVDLLRGVLAAVIQSRADRAGRKRGG
ncbi:MAG TPA: TrmH family RNA methyltransferase [Burkholderiaceae bacterium]|nr:TrmH family RNA methyltransferase [Burkholderiaceae bacterium]HQR69242.1 TrmH family RNA methyltransferase [Burkholderiaceae bacterium]